jgi:hypothetical protein
MAEEKQESTEFNMDELSESLKDIAHYGGTDDVRLQKYRLWLNQRLKTQKRLPLTQQDSIKEVSFRSGWHITSDFVRKCLSHWGGEWLDFVPQAEAISWNLTTNLNINVFTEVQINQLLEDFAGYLVQLRELRLQTGFQIDSLHCGFLTCKFCERRGWKEEATLIPQPRDPKVLALNQQSYQSVFSS